MSGSEASAGEVSLATRFIKVYIRPRPDRHGRIWYLAYWFEGNGKNRKQRGKQLGLVEGRGRITKLQAEAMAREIERRLNAARIPPDPAPPVHANDDTVMTQPPTEAVGTALRECWKVWKLELATSHKQVPGTLRDKQIAFDKHIFPALGDRSVTLITRDDLQLIFNKMVEEAKEEGRGVTNVHKVRNYLSGLFVHIIEKRRVAGFEHNPLEYVDLPEKCRPLKPKLPAEAVLDEASKRLPNMSSILFDCIRTFGARPGEVTALQLKHVDLEDCTIDIVQHIRDGVLEQATKNQTNRRVDLTPELAGRLRDWILSHNLHDPDDWLFPARSRKGSNKPVNYSNLLRRDLKKVCKELGTAGITWKLLRHCFATAAVAAGVDPVTLQAIMGHQDIRTTYQYYAHVKEDVRKKWILELSKRMYASPKHVARAKAGSRNAPGHGQLTRIDDTANRKVMTQRVARIARSG